MSFPSRRDAPLANSSEGLRDLAAQLIAKWEDSWGVPGLSDRVLARILRERLGLEVGAALPCGSLQHGFTHRTLRLRVFRCEAKPGRVRLSGWDRHRWVTPDAFASLPLGTLDRRALALASRREGEDRS